MTRALALVIGNSSKFRESRRASPLDRLLERHRPHIGFELEGKDGRIGWMEQDPDTGKTEPLHQRRNRLDRPCGVDLDAGYVGPLAAERLHPRLQLLEYMERFLFGSGRRGIAFGNNAPRGVDQFGAARDQKIRARMCTHL